MLESALPEYDAPNSCWGLRQSPREEAAKSISEKALAGHAATQLEHFVELGIIVVKGQQPSSHGRVEEAAAQASSCLQSLALCIGSSSEGWDCREVQPQWLDLILKEVEGWDGEASWQQYVMKRMK